MPKDQPIEGGERSADDLFKSFKEVSITEFFRKNKAHLGYSGKVRSLTTVVHELVTNSLDACEEAGILPDLELNIKQLGVEHYRYSCRDNGPGIPAKHVSRVFGKMLAGTKFHRNIQLRGQQGIGVAGVTMFSQMTTGKPVRIRTSIGDGDVHEIHLLVDVSKNEADIVETKIYKERWRGTEIIGELKGVLFNLSEQGPYEYLRRTAIANPHIRITFIDPEGRKSVFERASKEIPKRPEEVKSHPKGMDVDEISNMAKKTSATRVSSFLENDFSRISKSKVNEIQSKVHFDLKKNPRKLSWSEAEELAKAFEAVDFMAPPIAGLCPIGEAQVRKAVLNILKPEFEAVVERTPAVHSGGVPFQIEVAVAYGGNAGREITDGGMRTEVMRFSNRVPLLFDAGGCALQQAANSVDWKRYGIRDFDNSPFTVFINLISTHIPYTSAGKQSVASDDEIVKEIRMALMDVGRKFNRYHSRKRRDLERAERFNTLMRYSGELAKAISALTGGDEKELEERIKDIVTKKLKFTPQEEPDKKPGKKKKVEEGDEE
ncbi:MAG TPA: DNA topoisomerase VI subunit B [Candidatus Altiarchaeales archaeon]|nr:DNA topoisomerase VI subunit B [Candidatus Altiarchaeales archaeon]